MIKYSYIYQWYFVNIFLEMSYITLHFANFWFHRVRRPLYRVTNVKSWICYMIKRAFVLANETMDKMKTLLNTLKYFFWLSKVWKIILGSTSVIRIINVSIGGPRDHVSPKSDFTGSILWFGPPYFRQGNVLIFICKYHKYTCSIFIDVKIYFKGRKKYKILNFLLSV